VLFGRIANIPRKLQQTPQPLYNFDDIVMDIKYKMQGCQRLAKERLIKFKEVQKQKVKSNEREFKENYLVLLRVEARQKLEPLWKGPFEIHEINRPNATIQEIGKRKKHVVHLNRQKPYFSLVPGTKDVSHQMDPYDNTKCTVESTSGTNYARNKVKGRNIF
jgi:hypothetical protein